MKENLISAFGKDEMSADTSNAYPPEWLPPVIDFNAHQWDAFLELTYAIFQKDFVHSKPKFFGIPMRLKRHPVINGKEATFWHFISEGEIESERTPDIPRASRIPWVRPIIENADKFKALSTRVYWWKTRRRNETRYLLALPDFSHVIVIADRGDYTLPWTHYPVLQEHRKRKLRKEFERFLSNH